MNIIYFTMKKLNENKTFLAMLCFLFVFSCSKDKKEGNGDGKEDPTKDDPTPTAIKYTLAITKPTNGTLSSNAGGISCGSEGNDCKAEFEKDTEVTLTATADTGYVPTAWHGACDKTKATENTCKLSMNANKTASRVFLVDTDGDEVPDVDDVDDDNDGLIEIHDLDMFNHIQYSLAGTSYKNSDSASDNREGAPEEATDDCTTIVTDTVFYLCGYELARDLDFAEGASYAGSSVNTDWRPDDSDTSVATNEGFSGASNFAGIFEGNGHSISNLYSRGGGVHVGLFRSTTSAASIRNLGVVDANLYLSDSDANSRAGGLVGSNLGSIVSSYVRGGTVNRSHYNAGQIGGLAGYNQGSIRGSHATGAVNGDSGIDNVGGLVGQMSGTNSIIASYATGAVNGGAGVDDVGGLVGYMHIGTNSITASYATGATNGGAGGDFVGGLVGNMGVGTNTIIASYATGATNGNAGGDTVGGLVSYMHIGTNSITASYATGAANGDAANDTVGGLVGLIEFGTNSITASYATGAANGDAANDTVGGLVGYMHIGTNSITASYATGNPDGGDPAGTDIVGALVGSVTADGMGITNAIVHSYAFGTPANDDTTGNAGTAHPAGLSGSGAAKANTLTKPPGGENTDADVVWDQTGSKTKDAWDFGSNTQAPALKYADYDGDMAGVDYCALFPDKIPGTDTDLVCGTANASLLPGQGR